MSNYHLRDKELSLKAKGLLSFMLSLPEDWDYSLKGLVAICKENKDAIRSALDELKRLYYLKIELSRTKKGKFDYDYLIYEKPFKNRSREEISPNTENPYTDIPYMDNPPQINTNIQIDKLDKTDNNFNFSEEIKHNILTNELIQLNYIEEDDISSFYFDNLFQKYLSDGHNYKELYGAIHYIVPRILSRDFIDEDGNKILNKYGYFKNAIESNFNKLSELRKDAEKDKNIWEDYEL